MNRAQFLRTVLLAGSSLAAVTFSLTAYAQGGSQPAATASPDRDVRFPGMPVTYGASLTLNY